MTITSLHCVLPAMQHMSLSCLVSAPERPPSVKLTATLTSMSCTSSRPLGAIWRRLTTQTRNMLKRITPEETSLSSLPYLHTAQALNHSTRFQLFARD